MAKSAQGKLYSKGSPFHFLLFQGNIQNRTCPKGPPFGFFSELCDFFSKIFYCPQRVPPLSFWYFATECLLINPEGSPLLHFSALCDFFWKKNFFQKFQFFFKKSVLRFLSLRYDADFRRSRLVLNWMKYPRIRHEKSWDLDVSWKIFEKRFILRFGSTFYLFLSDYHPKMAPTSENRTTYSASTQRNWGE